MNVKIYSTKTCGYCRLAKDWFDSNNINYDEILLDNQQAMAEFKEDCPGLKTVPQIFVLNQLIDGGYDGLMENKEEVLSLLT